MLLFTGWIAFGRLLWCTRTVYPYLDLYYGQKGGITTSNIATTTIYRRTATINDDDSARIESDATETVHWVLEATLIGIHARTIRSVVFAPLASSLVLASASFDGTVAIWQRLSMVHHPQSSSSSAASAAALAAGWECTAQLEGHENEVKCVSFNATGSLLASCGRDRTIWLWECYLPESVGGASRPDAAIAPHYHNAHNPHEAYGDFECIAVLNAHEADVKCVVFAPSHGQWGDGPEIVLSASYDDTIKCWAEDAGDWFCAASIAGVHTSTIWSLTVSPSGSRLISASADGSLAIYKCYTISEKKALLAADPDSKDTNLTGSGGFWKCVGKLEGAHAGTIYTVAYAPACAGHGRIISGSADGRLQIYKEAMGSTSDRPLFLTDTAVDAGQGEVNHVTWHPVDGSTVASAGDDGTVRIWNYQA